MVSRNNEGIPFVILQTAFEDIQGVKSLSTLARLDELDNNLISDKAIRSILMLDFWNSVYSWRRGVLMAYVPKETVLTDSGTFDLEDKWIAAIKTSPYADQSDTPEKHFLELYDSDDTNSYHQRITKYIYKVGRRLKTAEGLKDYLCLAESRRRIYRPLPLNEFGVQLPYALALPVDWAKTEMREDATTADIPARGVEWLDAWTGSLAGFDPRIVPSANDVTGGVACGARSVGCPAMRA